MTSNSINLQCSAGIGSVGEQIAGLKLRLQFAKEVGNDNAISKIKEELSKIISEKLTIPIDIIDPQNIIPGNQPGLIASFDTSENAPRDINTLTLVEKVKGIDHVDFSKIEFRKKSNGEELSPARIITSKAEAGWINDPGLYPIDLHGNRLYLAIWADEKNERRRYVFHEDWEGAQEVINDVAKYFKREDKNKSRCSRCGNGFDAYNLREHHINEQDMLLCKECQEQAGLNVPHPMHEFKCRLCGGYKLKELAVMHGDPSSFFFVCENCEINGPPEDLV